MASKGLPEDSCYCLKIEPETAEGEAISLEKFLGPRYDRSARTLLFDYTDNRKKYNIPNEATLGYAYAFSDPPYGLRCESNEKIIGLFNELNELLFNNFRDKLYIYSWSRDWSRYFDAGKEWWGTDLWTVHVPDKKYIVGIGASSTD